MKHLFHVHTYRCGHAENISEELYVEKAITLNASDIWFTDHAPFPNDPFGGRMKYEQLNEYIETLLQLKEKYKEKINVHIGLEIEYFPRYKEYYKELTANNNIEILLLGQHMYQIENGYSFSLPQETLDKEEYIGLGKAIVEGMKTGLFKICAHPDRIYRRQNQNWTKEMDEMAKQTIETAHHTNTILEQNISSMRDDLYRDEFWNLKNSLNEDKTIIGLDAHYLKELK